jgi:hypothetical protein
MQGIQNSQKQILKEKKTVVGHTLPIFKTIWAYNNDNEILV